MDFFCATLNWTSVRLSSVDRLNNGRDEILKSKSCDGNYAVFYPISFRVPLMIIEPHLKLLMAPLKLDRPKAFAPFVISFGDYALCFEYVCLPTNKLSNSRTRNSIKFPSSPFTSRKTRKPFTKQTISFHFSHLHADGWCMTAILLIFSSFNNDVNEKAHWPTVA